MKLNPEQRIFLVKIKNEVSYFLGQHRITHILQTGEYSVSDALWINSCKVDWYKKLNCKITKSE